jgi:hypothetical protein
MASNTNVALEYVRRQMGVGSKEVARTPAKQGIITSARYPTSIKGKATNRQTKKADMVATSAEKASAPIPTLAKEPIMAKKEKVNKTKAVAAYLRTKPDATASEIVDAMAMQKIKLTVAYAANLKSTIKAKRAEKKAAKAQAAPAAAPAAAPEPAAPVEKPAKDAVSLEHVKAVAKTVKDIGGFARLNELLGVVKEVGGMKKFRDLMEAMAMPETDKIPF